jgi:hypothetical protein
MLVDEFLQTGNVDLRGDVEVRVRVVDEEFKEFEARPLLQI